MCEREVHASFVCGYQPRCSYAHFKLFWSTIGYTRVHNLPLREAFTEREISCHHAIDCAVSNDALLPSRLDPTNESRLFVQLVSLAQQPQPGTRHWDATGANSHRCIGLQLGQWYHCLLGHHCECRTSVANFDGGGRDGYHVQTSHQVTRL
jgi:hypothetical protein